LLTCAGEQSVHAKEGKTTVGEGVRIVAIIGR